MERITIIVIDDNICKSFLRIVKKELNNFNKRYYFTIIKISDATKIKKIKKSKKKFPILRLQDNTEVNSLKECVDFLNGPKSRGGSSNSSDDIDIKAYMHESMLESMNNEDDDSLGDTMSNKDIQQRMADYQRGPAATTTSKKKSYQADDEGEDAFDKAMRTVKIDNISSNSLNDLNVRGIEMDKDTELMLQRMINL